MVRYPRDPRPGLGPVHHARRTRHADGTRRSRQRGVPATGPGPHHPQPRKVRTTRAPEGELAATRNAHRTTRKETIVNPEPAVGGGARAGKPAVAQALAQRPGRPRTTNTGTSSRARPAPGS